MASPLTILLDTNIIIPSEPEVDSGISDNTERALSFWRHASNAQCRLYYHPAIEYDIARDSDLSRADKFRVAKERYNPLSDPPGIDILPKADVGEPQEFSNSWVDNHLLASVAGNAIDFLVTEDKGIHKKASRIGISSRVLNLSDAIDLVTSLFDKEAPPLPLVESVKAHTISLSDPILDSLRNDYNRFNDWFAKCQREQRDVYIIKTENAQGLSAICITKPEDAVEGGPKGKTLKLCTFKVAEEGSLFGELLLKAVFSFTRLNHYEYMYFTVFDEKHPRLVDFAESFGFSALPERNEKGELILFKELILPNDCAQDLAPFDYHVAYGPFVTKFEGNSTFIIPIQPQWHKMLFPEFENQARLFAPREPCGNSIKKIYLCHSKITQLQKGDNIAFYRSEDYQGITALGIVEDTLRSDSASEIAAFSALRTVFSFNSIIELCEKEVLAIKFRLVRFFEKTIKLDRLVQSGGLKAQPQSIHLLTSNATERIQQRIKVEDIAL